MAGIDDFKAAETGAVTGDARPLIPPLQTGGEGDFQEVHYRHTRTKIARYTCMHPVNCNVLQCTHREIGEECVCFLEKDEGQSKAGILRGEGGRMSLRIIEVTWILPLLLPGVFGQKTPSELLRT